MRTRYPHLSVILSPILNKDLTSHKNNIKDIQTVNEYMIMARKILFYYDAYTIKKTETRPLDLTLLGENIT